MISEMEGVEERKTARQLWGISLTYCLLQQPVCLWWWWSWTTLASWPKTDVSSSGLVPYSCFTPPQACASGGQPEASGGDLRIKLVFQHCCLWWWDGTCLCVGSLAVNTVLCRSRLGSRSGLASSVWLEPGLLIYSWSLALGWKSKQRSGRLNKQPSQNQTATPSSSSCSTAALSHHFITPWCWMGPLHVGRVYDPAFSDQGSRYGSPSKALSDTTVTSGLLWVDWSALKRRL